MRPRQPCPTRSRQSCLSAPRLRRHPRLPDPTLPGRGEPGRTCVGCRVKQGKATLVRVVRRPDGSVEVDPTGKASGRGAYVHRDDGCIQLAVRRGSIGRALKAPLGPAQAARLMEELHALAGDDR